MAQLAPMMQLRARFEDKCGHPLAGGSVFAFEVGTSTPKGTYADAEGTKQNTHPIKLDYRGEADIFLLSGRYRFVVYSCTGVKIYDVDNVGEWLGPVSADNVYDGNKTQHEINQEQADKNASLSQEIVDAVNVEKERALSAETVLNQSIQNEINRATEAEQALTQSVINETNRATSAEVALQNQVNALGGGTYGFNTYSAFDAVKSTIPANSLVNISEVNNTGTGSWGQGDNVWDGTNLTKSPYDPLQQSKDFVNANKSFKPQPIVEPTDFNTLRDYGFYYFFSGATWDSSPNKPPFNNQWAYMLVMPVSADVVAQYVWAFNSKKIAYRFSNASAQWSTWGVFSDDATLTAAIESSVNTDLDGTFDARAFNSITPNFETLTKNLFDKKAPLLLNRRIDQFGELEKHQKSVTTSLINVQGLSSIAVSGLQASTQAYRAYRFLDKDKKLIDNDPIDLNKTSVVIPVPANSVFFQVCLKDGIDTWALNLDTIQFESGTTVSPYEAYIRGNLKSLYGADIAGTTQSASKAYGASVAIAGDSITETSNVDNGIVNQPTYRIQWPTTLFEKLKPVKFSNYAKSGASFKESGQTNQWQMISHQINMMISNQENPDIIIVAMGTNDMNPKDGETTPNFEKLGDYDTAMSKTTLASLDRTLSLEAARWAFWTIRKNFPNAVCFYANPLQRALATSEVLAPFIEGFSKLALRHGFNLIDQHHELGIVHELEKSIGNGQFLADGLHPNATGKILQANYILSKVIARMTY
ncbi:SGNH/GDSL hydrolase family protein [Acinetobacter baumannii]|uniref:SGNH/GDSL hydrolase family protein n=1 Tax=Acinetobacter baumannii TaxID=470 RepID=UPI00112B367A|nr:SGNH/GDSL hydrolase family protein [Acinetobacter baumannii]TPR75279.1 SGNH/GDSL hydrolase family protein [Acinetobacter baumannii]